MARGRAPRAATVGVAEHGSSAVLVTVAPGGELLDRRRIDLTDRGLPTHPHHREGSWAVGRYLNTPGARALSLADAVALVERVRASAARGAGESLEALAAAVPVPIARIAIRACPRLPPTTEERIADNRAQTVADSVMYREALAAAAEGRGWSVHWYDRERVLRDAAAALGREDVDAVLRAMGRSVGPPWQARHKLAAAAALASMYVRTARRGVIEDLLGRHLDTWPGHPSGQAVSRPAFLPRRVWDVVGGHYETGETPAGALVREFREEIGIEAIIVEEIAILGEPQPETHGEARYHMFIVTRWDGEPEIRNAEHSELRWVRASEAKDLPLAHPGYPGLFREALRRAVRTVRAHAPNVQKTPQDARSAGGIPGRESQDGTAGPRGKRRIPPALRGGLVLRARRTGDLVLGGPASGRSQRRAGRGSRISRGARAGGDPG